MKTICFFNSAMTWGGGEKWHFETAAFLKEKGYHVLFITNPESVLHKKLSSSAIKCIPLKVNNLSFMNPLSVIKLKKILIRNNVETIVINLSKDLKLAGLAAKAAKIERIIYRRGSAIPIKDSFLNRFYFQSIISDVLTNSEATKSTILINNPNLVEESKIKVIYNPIDIEQFTKKDYRKLYFKEADEIVIGCLGRLVRQKNQSFLINLAAELKSKNIPFKILIGGSGALEKSLKRYAKEKNVLNDVIFLGFCENVKDLLMSCDIFALPSLWEGFGYVLAEASLCKKPAIAFNISSMPELVVNNKTGFLTTVNDVQEFSNRIQLFKDEPALLNTFGECGYTYAKEKFSDEKIKNELLDFLTA